MRLRTGSAASSSSDFAARAASAGISGRCCIGACSIAIAAKIFAAPAMMGIEEMVATQRRLLLRHRLLGPTLEARAPLIRRGQDKHLERVMSLVSSWFRNKERVGQVKLMSRPHLLLGVMLRTFCHRRPGTGRSRSAAAGGCSRGPRPGGRCRGGPAGDRRGHGDPDRPRAGEGGARAADQQEEPDDRQRRCLRMICSNLSREVVTWSLRLMSV